MARNTYLTFPFVYADVEGLGRLFYPFVRVGLKTTLGWRDFDFLVDTGADVTTIPKQMLSLLDLSSSKLKKGTTRGVGDILVYTLETKLPIKIGHDSFPIHVSFVESHEDSSPLLLGRKDIFEKRFSLVLESRLQMTVLQKNRPPTRSF